MSRLIILLSLFLLPLTALAQAHPASSAATPLLSDSGNNGNGIDWQADYAHFMQHSDISPKVLRLAFDAYRHAEAKGIDPKGILTIIDYSRPSSDKRLWVLDLKDQDIDYHTLVAHGKKSGGLEANSFSNQRSSLKSSLGVYLTGKPYIGHHGYALHLIGLEDGFNSNAFSRNVVFHTAWYVSEAFVKKYGYLGRSWGCPALPEKTGKAIMEIIKEGTLVFAYYPDKQWLSQSSYL